MSDDKFVSKSGELIVYKKDPEKASAMAEAEKDHDRAADLHAHAAKRHAETGDHDRALEHQKKAIHHQVMARKGN